MSSLSNEIKQRSDMIFEHDSIKLLCVLNESMVRERGERREGERKEMILRMSTGVVGYEVG